MCRYWRSSLTLINCFWIIYKIILSVSKNAPLGGAHHSFALLKILLIIIAVIATPIAKTQRVREVWFYLMSVGAVLKIVTILTDNILI